MKIVKKLKNFGKTQKNNRKIQEKSTKIAKSFSMVGNFCKIQKMYPIFEITNSSQSGRLGKITTKHGEIQTPAFVFCGTKGALKAQWPQMARSTGTQIMLSNTYHLLVHPGSKLIDELGGLQKMTAWHGPMMTDSGGYQIFSLGYGSVSQELKGIRNTKKTLVKISEEGARFKSYKNGDEIFLTPEAAMQAQIDFGADLVFVLDECTAFHIQKEQTQSSMLRSQRWAIRSVEYFNQHRKAHQGVYGIIQGGIYPDLRRKSIESLNDLDKLGSFFGVGIGGSLGKDIADMEEVLKIVVSDLAQFENLEKKPRHLLGIGTIDAILMAVPYGIDTFDCVYPTRLARHGSALVSPDIIEKEFGSTRAKKALEWQKTRYLNLNNAIYEKDQSPIDKECNCCTCASFSRAYIHMMLKAGENLAIMALTEHNIAFMNKFMSSVRNALRNGAWSEFKAAWTR